MNKLLNHYTKTYSVPFKGWDFSAIFSTGSAVESPLTWNYYDKIIPHIRNANTMLDMGTGGGEFLLSLAPLPEKAFATEAYRPNVAVAKRNLKPHGVKVISKFTDNALPFKDDFFDLVINRHESYSAKEVYRIVRPDGRFITQQVGGKNDFDLNRMLGAPVPKEYLHWKRSYAARELNKAGFIIEDSFEQKGYTRFFSIEALLRYMKAEPWQVEGFTVEKYFDRLEKIDGRIKSSGYVDINAERFFVSAKKRPLPAHPRRAFPPRRGGDKK